MATATIKFSTTGYLTSEEQQRIKDVMLRALSEYSPSKMNDLELEAIVKIRLTDFS